MRSYLSLLATAILVTGCGSSTPPEPPPVKDTVYGDQVEAMNKARALNETSKERKEDLDKAIDANEQGRSE
jgi:hypothetical protein